MSSFPCSTENDDFLYAAFLLSSPSSRYEQQVDHERAVAYQAVEDNCLTPLVVVYDLCVHVRQT